MLQINFGMNHISSAGSITQPADLLYSTTLSYNCATTAPFIELGQQSLDPDVTL